MKYRLIIHFIHSIVYGGNIHSTDIPANSLFAEPLPVDMPPAHVLGRCIEMSTHEGGVVTIDKGTLRWVPMANIRSIELVSTEYIS